LLAGRDFNDSDRQGAPAVMIISKELADTAFAGEDPIGKQLCFTRGQGITVIGMAENVHHYGVTENAPPEFYIPIDQAPEPAIGWMAGSAELIVRTQGATESIAGEIRSLVNRIEPAAPVYKIEAMKARVAETLEERRFTTTLLTSFAALAVFLAAVGIYGVLSCIVTQRSQEIGIRMALGAQRGSVLRMMVGEGLRFAAIGNVVGVAGSLAVARLLRSMLYRVAPTDAATFSACALLILGLAALASYIPARRALRVDPVRAIRTE
jgi:putative ABC transport system permease protein